MCEHEQKQCPRCGESFQCKPGNITQCHCFNVQLTDEERSLLEKKFVDCVCGNCLAQLMQDLDSFEREYKT